MVARQMSEILTLKDERVDRKLVVVREKLVTLENHYQEMAKSQMMERVRDIVDSMVDILEVMDK